MLVLGVSLQHHRVKHGSDTFTSFFNRHHQVRQSSGDITSFFNQHYQVNNRLPLTSTIHIYQHGDMVTLIIPATITSPDNQHHQIINHQHCQVVTDEWLSGLLLTGGVSAIQCKPSLHLTSELTAL